VIVHGLGSVKENHADLAGALVAAGMGALALDLRGHGASAGTAGPGMVDDVLAAVRHLAPGGPVGIRGSSLGAFLALHAAAREPAVRAVAALCPAVADGLGQRPGLAWAREMPLEPIVARADGVARGYWHATGDEVVPWARTFALAGRTAQPKALRIVMGGHHRSLQHDSRVRAETVAFLAARLGAG